MAKKFDTNPLDPDFPQRTKAAAASTAKQQTPFKTAEFPPAPSSIIEEETRRFGQADFPAYWQTNQQQAAAPLYHAPPFSEMNAASGRKVAKIGMPEKFLIGLPYLPFYIGLVAGLILLLVVPKEEAKVRFHASQGLAAHLAILIITSILGIVGGLADLGSFIFSIVTMCMLVVFAIKAWQGKPVHIEAVDDLTNFLEEKIGPLKS